MDDSRYIIKLTKWFAIYDTKRFVAILKASNIDEAWNKTLTKWRFVKLGYKAIGESDTCGLCNLYHKDACVDCPIYKYTGYMHCISTPIDFYENGDDIDSVIKFLYMVRNASK
jgi:hypothetical protein